MCNINHPTFPCTICAKNIHDKDKAVQSDLCQLWIHIKCKNLKTSVLVVSWLSWHCMECCSPIFPFNSLSRNKYFLAYCTTTSSNITQWKNLQNDHNSSLKPSPNLELLANQFNNATPEKSNDPDKISSSKYYKLRK